MYYNALDFVLDTLNDYEWLLEDGGQLIIEDEDGDIMGIHDDDGICIEGYGNGAVPVLFKNAAGQGNFFRIVGGVF